LFRERKGKGLPLCSYHERKKEQVGADIRRQFIGKKRNDSAGQGGHGGEKLRDENKKRRGER